MTWCAETDDWNLTLDFSLTSQGHKQELPGHKVINKSCQETTKLAGWKGSEVKVNVPGVKMLTCMERTCPKASVCQILKVYLNWYGSYEQFLKPKHKFWNLNADSEVKV